MSRNGRRDRGGRERGGRGGRELAMFGGGFDADPFSRMDEMMGGSMAGMFGGGERGRGGGGRELSTGGADFGFGRMEQMMNEMISGGPIMPLGGAFGEGFGDAEGGGFFSSSSTMSFSSGDGVSRQYSSQTTSHRGGPGGNRVSETKSQYRDSSGVERAAWERSLNDRARMTIKERNRKAGQDMTTRERYHNMSERDAPEFDSEFGHAAQHVRQLQEQAGRQRLSGPAGSRGQGGRRAALEMGNSRRPQANYDRGGVDNLSRRGSRNGMAALPSSRGGGGGNNYDQRGSSRASSRASSSASRLDNHLGDID